MLELIISKINNNKKILIFENGKLIEQYDENMNTKENIGYI